MKGKYFLALIILCGCIANLQAQTSKNNPYFLPTIFRQPPNATAFEKYGNYGVNMFSGVPDISIPLYEIKSGELSVPITLSYHASGNKVNDMASWVGLGWSLSTGGEINRRVMGLPDDAGTVGYLNGTILMAAGNNINDTFDQGRTFMAQVKDRLYDMEPDIYSYSYPGGGGKFFLNAKDNNKPVLLPFAPVKVNMTGKANSFTITDEKGNRNFFGTSVTSQGTFSYGLTSSNAASGWPLEKVISQSAKDTVNFTYSGVSYGMPSESTETIVVDDISGSDISSSSSSNGSFVTEQQLNTIFFKNGKAVFKLADTQRQDVTGTNGPKSLQAIEIYRYDFNLRTYALVKKIWFYQSYFYNGTDAGSRRLRLDSIGVIDANGQATQKHRFYYNPLMLPDCNSRGKDYWGYYNGKNGQTSLIPRMSIDYITGPDSWTPGGTPNQLIIGSSTIDGREPDPNYMQAAMLLRIQYPTGGYTDFSYEANRYFDELGALKLAGGLRIRGIRSYDGISPLPIVKTYQYNAARKNFDINSRSFMTGQTVRTFYSIPGTPGNMSYYDSRRRTYVSVPTTDINGWDNVPVAYTTVTEYTGDGTTNVGKTVYNFTDYTDARTSGSYTGVPSYVSYFFKRGQLASKSVYNNIGSGTYKIVQKEQMTYSAFPEANYAGVGFLVGKRRVNVNPGGYDITFPTTSGFAGTDDSGQLQPAFYSIVSDDNYLTSKQVTIYDQADTTKFLTNTTQYLYNNIKHQQVSKEISTDSKGKVNISTKTYVADYLPTGASTTTNAVLDSMINRNMLSVPVEMYDTLKSAAVPAGVVTGGVLNLYKAGSANAIVPANILKLRVQNPLTDFQPTSIISGGINRDSRYQEMIAFTTYDTKNNITQYTPRNASPTAILWDYNNDLPIAEIKNSTTAGIAYTSFEAQGNGNWTIPGNLRSAGGITGSKSYNLANGAVSKGGLTAAKSYYITYWTNNAAPYTITGTQTGYPVKGTTTNGWTMYQHLVTGVTSVSISGTSNIDELRLYPSDAQMTTYTYDPLIGQTSMSDTKGAASYYEYDNLQRLKAVKDRDGNIVKANSYNYGTYTNASMPTAQFYSYVQTRSVQKNNCTGGLVGSWVTYVVNDGKYTSAISQEAANQLAADDLNANGQTYANANGTCLIPRYNVATSRSFTKNNCGVNKPGSTVTRTVPAGTYMSTESVEAANQMAENYLDTQGQFDANRVGTCPLGNDMANWTITAGVNIDPPSNGHSLNITITRPEGDRGNWNDVAYHITLTGHSDATFNATFMPGQTVYTYKPAFSYSLSGVYTGIYLDAIN
ncbi:MAG: DUF5977 domain-containing protein [Bacteroidota bacterium]